LELRRACDLDKNVDRTKITQSGVGKQRAIHRDLWRIARKRLQRGRLAERRARDRTRPEMTARAYEAMPVALA
jgi:hypothetical protein